MAYTIRQFVNAALEELGLASYAYDMEPDQLLSVARRYNSMIAEWDARGIRLGATIYSDPDSVDLDAASGVPDRANEAIIINLAMRVAPMFGKTPMPDSRMNARRAYSAMLIHYAQPMQMSMPSNVAGAGNKPWINGNPFTDQTADPLIAGPDSELEFY